jgi:hypothetical protein
MVIKTPKDLRELDTMWGNHSKTHQSVGRRWGDMGFVMEIPSVLEIT